MRQRMLGVIVPPLLAGVAVALLAAGGCANKPAAAKDPVFKLAWSEYPSWSVFGVAADLGLIDGAEGKQGTLEKKWGVDVVLDQLGYDPCIQMYADKGCDAVCATNVDALAPAAGRRSVAVLPTSTSDGADACLVVGIDVADRRKAVVELRKHKVYGLARRVSEYAFDRNLQLLGEDPKKHHFSDEPPDKAAAAMAARQKDHTAIMVWNPFVLTVLRSNPEAKVLLDSSTIPEEIIDMVIVAQDALDREKGQAFACCLIDTFYEMNRRLHDANREKADAVLVKLGEKFSHLKLEDMKTVVRQTRFYKTPDEALKLFNGPKLPETMKLVSQFCLDKEAIKKATSYGFGTKEKAPDAQLRFDPSYVQEVRDRQD